MINAHMKNRQSAPVWAILGAPLVGIPLLVALLALAHPRAESTEPDAESMVTIEHMEEIEEIDDHRAVTPASCDPRAPAVAVRNG